MAKLLNHSPASNTAAVITIGAVDGSVGVGPGVLLAGVSWSYDGVPTGGNLKIESPSGTVLQSWDITDSGPGFFPIPSGMGAVGGSLIITLAAGGSECTGKVNAIVQ